MNLTDLKAWEIQAGYRNRDFSCEEVIKAHIENIKEKEKDINAFITITEDIALEKAKKIDEKFKNREELSDLAGIPISIKDNISMKDIKMTCASKILDNYISPYDATVTKIVKNNDGVILGKVNLDEFAMGATTNTSYYGLTKNPLDLTKVSGGSSGGSAASVASGECSISIGTDTGGSVRNPASYCGVVGMKPSYGSISRYGIASMANTFDQPGVIAKDVRDTVSLLKLLQGRDIKDATSLGNDKLDIDFDYSENSIEYLKGLKIAIPYLYTKMQLNKEVKENFDKSINFLNSSGAIIEEYDIDSLQYVIETYHILVNGEISSNMERFDSVRYGHRCENFNDIEQMYKKSRAEGFGDEVKRRIMVGTHILSLELAQDYYYKALKVRGLIKKDMDSMFSKYDIMLCPTVPILPFEADRELSPIEIYQADLFTIPANMIGGPSISLPMPKNDNNLSVGIEFTANRFCDDKLIKAAIAFERGVKNGL